MEAGFSLRSVDMYDQMDKRGSEIEVIKTCDSPTPLPPCDVTSSSGSEGQPIKKTCSDCGTSKTPLWRGGPDGPKSLCNACGIRQRKRRRALMGLPPHDPKKPKKSSVDVISNTHSNSSGSSNGGSSEEELDVVVDHDKMRAASAAASSAAKNPIKLTGLTWQRSTAQIQSRKLGEEEQAAVLLMAMAYGSSIFA